MVAVVLPGNLEKNFKITFSKYTILGFIILSQVWSMAIFRDAWSLLYSNTDFHLYYWFRLMKRSRRFVLKKLSRFKITTFKNKKKGVCWTQKIKKLNFFLYSILLKKKQNNKIISNELVNSFWPGKNTEINILYSVAKISKFVVKKPKNFFKYIKNFKQKKKTLFLILNKFKQKKKTLKNSKFSLRFKKKLIKKFNFWRKFRYKKRLTRFHNFHRRLIKLFWKSQEFFKKHYSEKRRWTVKKFKYFFLRWYKKANCLVTTPSTYQNTHIPVIWLLFYLGFFLSKKDASQAIDSGLVTLNGEYFFNPQQNLFVNDILCFYKNYYKFFKNFDGRRKFYRKKYNKKQYILYKNRASQWRQTRKTKPKEVQINLFRRNRYPCWLHYNFLSSSVALIKNPRKYKNNFLFLTRHALEKLNTWKLNI